MLQLSKMAVMDSQQPQQDFPGWLTRSGLIKFKLVE
jgi:hypothetical protein